VTQLRTRSFWKRWSNSFISSWCDAKRVSWERVKQSEREIILMLLEFWVYNLNLIKNVIITCYSLRSFLLIQFLKIRWIVKKMMNFQSCKALLNVKTESKTKTIVIKCQTKVQEGLMQNLEMWIWIESFKSSLKKPSEQTLFMWECIKKWVQMKMSLLIA